jgi:hypothetical protein
MPTALVPLPFGGSATRPFTSMLAKLTLVVVALFVVGCGVSRDSLVDMRLDVNVTIRGSGEILDPELRRQYEADLRAYHNTDMIIRIFMDRPIPPVAVRIPSSDLRVCLCDRDANVLDSRAVIIGNNKITLAGRGGGLQLRISQGKSYYDLDKSVNCDARYFINVIPGVVVQKTGF